MKRFFLASLVTTNLLFASSSAEININNNTLELATDIYLNDTFNLNNSSNYYYGISHLRTKSDENQDSQNLTTMNFKVLNPYVDDYGMSLGIGIKTVYTSQLEKSFNAIALALYFKYELNEMFYVSIDGSYAPRVLSFMDAESYNDAKLKLNYKVLDGGYMYVGLRKIETTYENNQKVEFDDAAFFGYQFRF
ncbi:MAG: YfaZ family outer membrane protein [Campylobacterota bacterium]|nr:YfaZ family outer membrane protein [Campylobacterota bacterium]